MQCTEMWSLSVSQFPQETGGKPIQICVHMDVSALLDRLRCLEKYSRRDVLQSKAPTQEEIHTFVILIDVGLAYL